MHRRLLEYSPEGETYDAISAASIGGRNTDVVFSEAEELELAADLLGIANKAELEQFLGDVVDRAGRAIGRAVPPSQRGALADLLATTTKHALPFLDRAPLGPSLQDSDVDAADAAAKYLGLELEGLSPEDQEFEAAKQFIRFAADAVKNAAAGPVPASPQAATARAARRYAPGLHGNLPDMAAPIGKPAVSATSGRWVREGSNIIVFSS